MDLFSLLSMKYLLHKPTLLSTPNPEFIIYLHLPNTIKTPNFVSMLVTCVCTLIATSPISSCQEHVVVLPATITSANPYHPLSHPTPTFPSTVQSSSNAKQFVMSLHLLQKQRQLHSFSMHKISSIFAKPFTILATLNHPHL